MRRAAPGGLLLGAAFLSPWLGALVLAGFVPVLGALDARARGPRPLRGAFATGWIAGFAFYLVGAYWLVMLNGVAITVPWLKYPGWLAAAAYLALYAGLAGVLAVAAHRRSGAPLGLTFAAAWMVAEQLRGAGELGFPWFQPGYALASFAPAVQVASLGGAGLVTLLVLAANGLAWHAWRGVRAGRTPAGLLAALAFVLLFPLAWGAAALRAAPQTAPDAPQVVLVQPNIPGEMKWSGRHTTEILVRFARLTTAAVGDTPAVAVFWPETATGSYLRRAVDQTLRVSGLAARLHTPIFTGFPDARIAPGGEVRYENAAGFFPPDGSLPEPYAKRHLVPFGERMPFQSWIPGLRDVQLGQAEWSPGDRWTLFPSAAGPFACLICFESIFPDQARGFVRRGARWLVNVTNDEWFGPGAALEQHAAMGRLRTIEHHVPLVRVANTGITMVIDANGRTVARLPEWREGTLRVPLPATGPPTPYTSLGDWPFPLAAIVLAACLAVRRSQVAAAPPALGDAAH